MELQLVLLLRSDRLHGNEGGKVRHLFINNSWMIRGPLHRMYVDLLFNVESILGDPLHVH